MGFAIFYFFMASSLNVTRVTSDVRFEILYIYIYIYFFFLFFYDLFIFLVGFLSGVSFLLSFICLRKLLSDVFFLFNRRTEV